VQQAERFVAVFRCGGDGLRKTEASTEKAGVLRCAQTFARAGEEGKDGAAIVAAQIHCAVEMLGAQGAEDGPVLSQAGFARNGPDAVHCGVVLLHGCGGFGDESVQFAIVNARAERHQRGDAHHGVAEGFELDG